jgi:pimeloyl-ACP methyl ester carboxylesterase
MPLDYARRMLAELPAASLLEIPRCGHVPQVECPAAFLAALQPVLAERP